MEPLVKFEDIVTHVGVNAFLLPYLGDYPTCVLYMTILNKKIRKHWREWEDEYKKACFSPLIRLKLDDFTKGTTQFLLKNSEYKNNSLNIIIYSMIGFREFVDFLLKVKDFKDLKIESFSISSNLHWTKEDDKTYLKY